VLLLVLGEGGVYVKGYRPVQLEPPALLAEIAYLAMMRCVGLGVGFTSGKPAALIEVVR